MGIGDGAEQSATETRGLRKIHRREWSALFGMGDKGLHAPVGGADLYRSLVHTARTIS